VQGFMRVPMEMKNCDMYVCSSHKIHGPKGEGALIYQKNTRISPRQIGGGQESGMRSGTENTPGIAGFHEAIKLMETCDMAALKQMKLYMVEKFLAAVDGAVVNGPAPEDGAPHIVNISFVGVRGETMLHALEAKNVYAST